MCWFNFVYWSIVNINTIYLLVWIAIIRFKCMFSNSRNMLLEFNTLTDNFRFIFWFNGLFQFCKNDFIGKYAVERICFQVLEFLKTHTGLGSILNYSYKSINWIPDTQEKLGKNHIKFLNKPLISQITFLFFGLFKI